MSVAVLYIASALTGLWGVVRGFGDLTTDNARIITMEWIVEGVALLSIALSLRRPRFNLAVPSLQPSTQWRSARW